MERDEQENNEVTFTRQFKLGEFPEKTQG